MYFDDETRCLRVGALIMTNSVQRFYEGQGRIGFGNVSILKLCFN